MTSVVFRGRRGVATIVRKGRWEYARWEVTYSGFGWACRKFARYADAETYAKRSVR